MKTINLKSLLEIYEKNGGINVPPAYMNYLGSKIKDTELNPLKSLISTLEANDPTLTLKDFNSFYIGYEVPQIGKEFDLLRINNSTILNIEYKREATSKVKNQLLKNSYYLKFLKREINLFTYIEKDNAIYKLDGNNELIQVDCQELIAIIKNQGNDEKFEEGNLNDLFEPNNYLISPFRKTEEFIKGEYFLTQEQDKIEKNLINAANSGGKYFFITGEAGSGKTLLTYHIAKKYIEAKHNVGILHCGILNAGHKELNEKFGWNIQQIKFWNNLFVNNKPEIIIIDEIQRIYSSQFNEILNTWIRPNNIILIMSGDGKQILKQGEGQIFETFDKQEYSNVEKFNLNTKIRTNKELANFIKIMLDLGKGKTLEASAQNIDIVYFNTIKDAHNYISTKSEHSYLSYTPSLYYSNKYTDGSKFNPQQKGNSHEVIGQEFENVIVVLGEHFYYDKNILKAYKLENNPNSTLKMFFQQITRAINKLEIVVVNNIEVFNRLIEIFEKKP